MGLGSACGGVVGGRRGMSVRTVSTPAGMHSTAVNVSAFAKALASTTSTPTRLQQHGWPRDAPTMIVVPKARSSNRGLRGGVD